MTFARILFLLRVCFHRLMKEKGEKKCPYIFRASRFSILDLHLLSSLVQSPQSRNIILNSLNSDLYYGHPPLGPSLKNIRFIFIKITRTPYAQPK